jgi:hypothetical protein
MADLNMSTHVVENESHSEYINNVKVTTQRIKIEKSHHDDDAYNEDNYNNVNTGSVNEQQSYNRGSISDTTNKLNYGEIYSSQKYYDQLKV